MNAQSSRFSLRSLVASALLVASLAACSASVPAEYPQAAINAQQASLYINSASAGAGAR